MSTIFQTLDIVYYHYTVFPVQLKMAARQLVLLELVLLVDTTQPKMLVEALQKLAVGGNIIGWIDSFLTQVFPVQLKMAACQLVLIAAVDCLVVPSSVSARLVCHCSTALGEKPYLFYCVL